MSAPAVRRHRWTRPDYERVVECGGFGPEDRGRKLAAFARNRVPEYWHMDLTAESLEAYREPSGSAYASKVILGRGDEIVPTNAPGEPIAVAYLLP